MSRNIICILTVALFIFIKCSQSKSSSKIQNISQFPFPIDNLFEISISQYDELRPLTTDGLVIRVGEISGEELELFVFDYGFKEELDRKFTGQFIDIPVCTKNHEHSLINIKILFKKAAQFKMFSIYHLNYYSRTNRQKILNNLNLAKKIYESLISLIIDPEIELTVKRASSDQSDEGSGQIITVNCRSIGGTPTETPRIIGLRQLQVRKHSFDKNRNELLVEINVRPIDHSKVLLCRAGEITRSLEIDIRDAAQQIMLEILDNRGTPFQASLQCSPRSDNSANTSDNNCRVLAYLSNVCQRHSSNGNTTDCFFNRSGRIISPHHQVISITSNDSQNRMKHKNENQTSSNKKNKENEILLLENEDLKRQVTTVKIELSNIKKVINDFKLKYEYESKRRKEKLKEIENKLIEEQKKNVNELKKEIKLVRDETESVKQNASQIKKENATKIDEINKIIRDLKLISNKSDESISNLKNEMRVLEKKQEQQNYGVIVWKIDKWKEKLEQARAGINTSINSDAFYSHRNGYKMRLSVDPNGFGIGTGTHLSVFFRLMRGEFDDILSWPFKHNVTFELINQHTTQIHTRWTDNYSNNAIYKGVYQKPTSDKNTAIGYPKFISLNELSNNLSLIDNDKIFIRCRILII